ncbi:MAG: hypothetical protein V1822_02110 [Candidatus Micrarchaeota archaeon]
MEGRKLSVSLICLAALTLAGVDFAQSTPFSFAQDAFKIPGWWGLALAGLSLSVLIIAISYMVGEAANLANVKAFAKQEVYELAATIIVVVLVLASLQAYGIFSKTIAGTTLIDPSGGQGFFIVGTCLENQKVYDVTDQSRPESYLFGQVDWFLGCLPIATDGELIMQTMREGEINFDSLTPYDNFWEVQQDMYGDQHSKGVMLGHMMNIYASVFSLEFFLGPISTFGVSTYVPEPLISSIELHMSPMAGLTPISEALIMLTDLIGVGMVTVVVQKVLLQYIYVNAIAVFLPVGIAFKAVPFLRKTGATLIAAALVLYFIFPLSIWINEQIYFNSLFSYDEQTGQYIPELVEWTNYQSILSLCAPEPGETYSQFEQRILQDGVQPFYDQSKEVNKDIMDGVYGGDFGDRLPRAFMRDLWDSFLRNGKTTAWDYVLNPASIVSQALPIEFLFSAIVNMFTTSMQWFVLNLLFLANTIILCMTFFKDLSLAIGGEPRIFGMSKLI